MLLYCLSLVPEVRVLPTLHSPIEKKKLDGERLKKKKMKEHTQIERTRQNEKEKRILRYVSLSFELSYTSSMMFKPLERPPLKIIYKHSGYDGQWTREKTHSLLASCSTIISE